MTAVFINGRFMTSEEDQIKELMQEVKQVGVTRSSHPYIYVDETDYEIDSNALSPMEVVRLKAREEARAELLAEQEMERARAMNINNVSNTDSEAFKTSLANSRNIAQTLEGASHLQFQKAPEVKVGVVPTTNPLAGETLAPQVVVPVDLKSETGVTIQESAAVNAPTGDDAKAKLAAMAANMAAKKA